MNEFEARAFLPLYATADPVKVYEPKQKRGGKHDPGILPWRMRLENKLHEWKLHHGIVTAFLIFLAGWTLVTVLITGAIVRYNTTVKVTSEMRANFTEYLKQQENQRQADQLLTGEASKQTAITQDAILLSRIGQGVLNTYKGSAHIEDARKAMLCALCRVYAGGEFANTRSIQEAYTQESWWWGLPERYTEDVYEAALEISRIYHNEEPMPCQPDMVYAEWNGEQIVLRNQWEKNSKARYY